MKTQQRAVGRLKAWKSNANDFVPVGLLVAVGAALLSIAAIASVWHGLPGAPGPTPTIRPREFFITTTWNDDFYPYWQATVTDAVQQLDGVLVSHLYVQSATQPCDEPDIKASERLLPEARTDVLAAPLDLCALDPVKINEFARHNTRQPKSFETARIGIVAICGTTVKSFEFPKYEMNEVRLKKNSPETLQLLQLGDRVLTAAFGKEQSEKLLSQKAEAEQLVTLKSDKFKTGFWFCLPGVHPAIAAGTGTTSDPTLGTDCDWARLQSVLARYKHAARGTRDIRARLVDSGGYKLLKYVAPEYRLFQPRQRVEGIVQLMLNVDAETGFVNDVSVTSGPDALRSYVVYAAKQWRFDPQQYISNPVKSTVEFPPPCSEDVY